MLSTINNRWLLSTINSRWALSIISNRWPLSIISKCKVEAIALHPRNNRKARKSQTNTDEEIKNAEGKVERAGRAT